MIMDTALCHGNLAFLTWRPTNIVGLKALPPHGTLRNTIEIAEFGSGEKVAPFVWGKFTDRAFWITCITDEDVLPPTCHPYTCTAFAGAGDTPLEISRGRCIC
jgi:hypothetical protein